MGEAVCREDENALEFTHADLRTNGALVRATVARYGLALAHASDDLQGDLGVVLLAAGNSNGARVYALGEVAKLIRFTKALQRTTRSF